MFTVRSRFLLLDLAHEPNQIIILRFFQNKFLNTSLEYWLDYFTCETRISRLTYSSAASTAEVQSSEMLGIGVIGRVK